MTFGFLTQVPDDTSELSYLGEGENTQIFKHSKGVDGRKDSYSTITNLSIKTDNEGKPLEVHVNGELYYVVLGDGNESTTGNKIINLYNPKTLQVLPFEENEENEYTPVFGKYIYGYNPWYGQSVTIQSNSPEELSYNVLSVDNRNNPGYSEEIIGVGKEEKEEERELEPNHSVVFTKELVTVGDYSLYIGAKIDDILNNKERKHNLYLVKKENGLKIAKLIETPNDVYWTKNNYHSFENSKIKDSKIGSNIDEQGHKNENEVHHDFWLKLLEKYQNDINDIIDENDFFVKKANVKK